LTLALTEASRHRDAIASVEAEFRARREAVMVLVAEGQIKVGEAADLLGVSANTIRRHARPGSASTPSKPAARISPSYPSNRHSAGLRLRALRGGVSPRPRRLLVGGVGCRGLVGVHVGDLHNRWRLLQVGLRGDHLSVDLVRA